MSAEKIIIEFKKKKYKPVYWLEGEESFFIDEVVDYAEKNILTEAEAGFNLTVFYGRDAEWANVVNACRRYPMFAENQVVILKEAQMMKEIGRLEGYILNPQPSTIFIVAHKDKKIDGREKLGKLLKTKTEYFLSAKVKDYQLSAWVTGYLSTNGYAITSKAQQLLIDHIGNDLNRLTNEVEKITVNLGDKKQITEDHIEEFVGISKEYNSFELQAAIMNRNLSKALTIIQYFESNPKAAPIQLILPTLYAFFSKVYLIFGLPHTNDESAVASALGISPFMTRDYISAAKNYKSAGVEQIILLLHEYNLKSIGINSSNVSDASLLKEMVVKIII